MQGLGRTGYWKGLGLAGGRKTARTGEEHLGASWGAQMEQVRGWTTAE